MDVRSLLISQHALVHPDAAFGQPAQPFVVGKPIHDSAWSRVSEQQARHEEPGHNSIAWILWHMARAEDMGVNGVVRGVPEVFDRDRWSQRLGVSRRELGTGWTAEETAALSATIDLQQLHAYREAVGRETRAWLEQADLGLLDQPVRPLDRVAFDGAFRAGVADRIWPLFAASSKSWVFVRLALWHNFFHLSEVAHAMQRCGINVNSPGP
jgi:hypothetical protein